MVKQKNNYDEKEKKLLQILDEEITVYEQILNIKELEREALLDFSTDRLEQTCRQQDACILLAGKLEQERLELVQDLCGRDKQQNPISFQELLQYVSDSAAAALKEKARLFLEVCGKVERMQQKNTQMMARAAEYMHDLMDQLIRRHQATQVAYGKDGTRLAGKEILPGLLDRRV